MCQTFLFFLKKTLLFSGSLTTCGTATSPRWSPPTYRTSSRYNLSKKWVQNWGGFDRMNSFPRKNRCVRACVTLTPKKIRKREEKKESPPRSHSIPPFSSPQLRSFSDNSGGGFGNGGEGGGGTVAAAAAPTKSSKLRSSSSVSSLFLCLSSCQNSSPRVKRGGMKEGTAGDDGTKNLRYISRHRTGEKMGS